MTPAEKYLTPEQYQEAVKFAAGLSLLKGLSKFTAPVLKPFKAMIGKPAQSGAKTWDYGAGATGAAATPASTAASMASAGNTAGTGIRGLMGTRPAQAVAGAATALPRYAWNNPGKVMAMGMGASAVGALKDQAANGANYADGLSTGLAQGLHQMGQAPWHQRLAFAMSPQGVLGSQGLADTIRQKIEDQSKQQGFMSSLFGGSVANNTLGKLQGLQSGHPMDMSGRVTDFGQGLGAQHVQMLRQLRDEIMRTPQTGVNAAPVP